jgi:hypothetical protein
MQPTKELKYTSKYYLVSHQQSEKVLLFKNLDSEKG